MAGLWVELEPLEVMMVSSIGLSRRLLASRYDRTHKVVAPVDVWRTDVNAAGAECAVAKYTGLYWSGCSVDRPRSRCADVGPLEVRHSPGSPFGKPPRLIVRPDDPEDRFYILVEGTLPRYLLHGFIWGWTAKQNRYKDDPGGHGVAYFVPPLALRTMTELVGALEETDDVPF